LVADSKLIRIQQDQSVQRQPDALTGSGQTLAFGSIGYRGNILSAPGSRDREWELLQYWNHDYNTLFTSAVAGLAKRIASTPYEIKGDDRQAAFYQDVLWAANFGAGFESFLEEFITNFSRFDSGVFVELIGPGDPLGPIVGYPTGIAILDTLRCWATGDPLYPAVYMDTDGALHLMPSDRVKHIMDMPDSYRQLAPYGKCALSRCIGTVKREILMNRYVEQSLDDNAPPGVMIFKNISEETLNEAFARLESEQNTDFGGRWGRVLRLYGLHAETMPEVNSIPYSVAPDKFDYTAYKELNVKEIALAIGLDIQDMWELTGGALGTGTQSEVLNQKSKGRALGRLYKTLERMLNQFLPLELEFAFHYSDPEEDQQIADQANTWTSVTLSLDGVVSQEEQRQLLANQVEAIRDVVSDDAGQVRVYDNDPKTSQQIKPQIQPAPVATVSDTTEAAPAQKALADTQRTFKQKFIELVTQVQQKSLSGPVVLPALRLALTEAGAQVIMDGMRDGGNAEAELTDNARTELAVWRARQMPYLRRFVEEITSKEFSPALIQRRAELWTNNSLNPLYFAGLRLANKDARYMWQVTIGAEHCLSCLKLNGQVHTIKGYETARFLPQSGRLICDGGCQCHLIPTTQAVRGRFRGVRFVVRKQHHPKVSPLERAYNPSQPRDDDGKFGSGGGGGGSLGDISGGKTEPAGGAAPTDGGDTSGGKASHPAINVSGKDAKVTKKVFGKDFEPDDISRVTGIDNVPGVDEVNISTRGDIVYARTGSPDDDTKPFMQREFWTTKKYDKDKGKWVKEKTCYNADFFLPKDQQGKGLGTKTFTAQVDNLRSEGFTNIKTLAGKGENMNGYYTWARLGYDGDIPSHAPKRPKALADATRVSDLMRSPEGRDWWKKNGVEMEMTFDLDANSNSSKVLDEYNRQKGNR
jgi:hypothetical protein